MSYGFKFLNNNSETVIDDTSVKPWFLRQAVAISAEVVTSTYNRINDSVVVDGGNEPNTLVWKPYVAPGVTSWAVYEIKYEVPNDYDCFIAYSLPLNTSVYYNCPVPYSLKAAPNLISIFAFVPNTRVATAADIPKAYIFVTDPVPPPTSTTAKYGIRLLSQSGAITYDSGYRHFQPVAVDILYIPDPDSYVYTQNNLIPDQLNTISVNLTNPVFLLPGIDLIKVGGIDWESGTNVALVNSVVYGRSSNGLLISVPRTKLQYVPAYTAPGFYNQALTGIQNFLVLDGNLLDQGNSTPELEPSYRLSKNKTSIEEGKTGVVITLNTTAVPNGTVVPYTISGTGITASDFVVSDLTREFIVSNNTSNTYIEAATDAFLEGIETATLSLDNGKSSITFTISDAITYALARSLPAPEEGQNILVYLTTGGIANGTLVPYTITGIQQSDLSFGSLTGNFTVQNSAAQLRFEFAKDIDYYEYETMRISVNSGATYIDIPITDIFYANETFTISPSSFTTTGTTTISATGIGNTSFEFIILPTGVNPVDTWNNRWLPQYASQVQIRSFDENGYYNNTTSIGNDFGGIGNWTMWIFTTYTKNFRSANVSVVATPTFSLTGSDGTKGPVTLNEGQTGYFLVTTTNIPNGTVVYPKAVNPRTAGTADIVNSAENGLTINNNTGSFTIQMVADLTTESDPDFNPTGQEYFTLVLDYPNGTRRDTYGQVNINDTSLTPASYSVTRSAASVNEGGGVNTGVIFTFTTNQNVTRYWTLTGMDFADIWYVSYAVDYGDGPFFESQGQINSGTIGPGGQVQIYFTADQMTEGAQTAVFDVRAGSITGTVLASNSVVINDTSLYPANGTASGGPYCQGFNKYQNYHNGSGGTYSTLIETNSAYCGFNVYDESVTIVSDANGDYRVPLNGYMTITLGQSEPYSFFTYAITNNGDPQPAQPFPASGQLDGYGNFQNYITGAMAQGSQTIGDKRLWVRFVYNNHIRSARYQVVYDSGTANGGTFCSGFNLRQNYNDGAGGIYTQTVQSNSPTCGYVQQYYPSMSSTYYTYWNVDFIRDIWYIYNAKPNSQVKFTIVAGPAYVGATATITVDSSGNGSYDIGAAGYAAGTYTINATFPGNDASYPSNYRTLVFYWIVYAGSGGGGGGY